MKKKLFRTLACALALLLLAGCAANVASVKDGAQYPAETAAAGMNYYYRTDALAEAPEAAYNVAGMPEGEPEPDWNTEEYDYMKENGFVAVSAQPFATFAADVDTAAYANLRRQLNNGETVRPDSVRVEEMINYFRYDYPQPQAGEPFSVTTEIAPCPWNEQTKLLSVGLQAKDLDRAEMPRSNLVFLIDVSGSMDYENKLPLVQRSFLTLVENLGEGDVVSIVTYSAGERVVLDGTPAENRQEIMGAIESLQASGSTNGEKAIQIAYDLAQKHYIEGGVNRVIMATDGDFNVGASSESELTRLVQSKAANGLFLSVLGYGMGNYKDNRLESMADNGNGNYAYIDSIDEARKVLVSEAGGTLFTVAKDVKLQVEFNPAAVKGYRLIGYENRVMSASDFADDTKDGGEIGAGHQVTALFEIVPVDSDFEVPAPESRYGSDKDADGAEFAGEFCVVNIRCKEPEGTESRLLSYPVDTASLRDSMSENLTWAAGLAETAMLLKNSEYKGTSSYEGVREMLEDIANDDFRQEFLRLLDKMD